MNLVDPRIQAVVPGTPDVPTTGAIQANQSTARPEGDVLVRLNLVDPNTGAALPTSDWQPTVTQSQTGTETTTAQGQTATAVGTAPNAPDYGALRQDYQNGVQLLNAQAMEARGYMLAQGMNPAQVEAMIQPMLRAEVAQLQMAIMQQATNASMAAMVAQQIAQKYPGVDAKLLEGLPDPGSMEAMAKAIQTMARDGRFVARAESKTDAVEGGPRTHAQISQLLDRVSAEGSATSLIALGLARGDLDR